MVGLFLVHKFSIVNRDPDKIKAKYIQYARQSSVSPFKKEMDEYCRHSWQREVKALMARSYVLKLLRAQSKEQHHENASTIS